MLGAADDSSLIEPFAKAFDLEIRSKADILADPDVHAVLVHSKSDRMADLSIEALEAGKAVLVEKPAGRNSADTKRIVDAVERTRGLLQVGYCWRFSPAVDAMQVALQGGRLGKVLQVRAHGACSHDEARTSHLNQPEDIGGTMFVIGCHLFDRIIHHFGMPLSVNARITKFANLYGGESREDAAGAVLNYADKIVVVDFFSWDPLPGWKAGTSRPTAPRGSCTRVLSPRATRSTTGATPARSKVGRSGTRRAFRSTGLPGRPNTPRARRDRQPGLFRP